MRMPKSVTSVAEKFTEEHKSLNQACRTAKGREEYEAARLAFNSKVTEDFGNLAAPVLQVSYDELSFFLRK